MRRFFLSLPTKKKKEKLSKGNGRKEMKGETTDRLSDWGRFSSIIQWCLFVGAKNLGEFHRVGRREEERGEKTKRRGKAKCAVERGGKGGENAIRARSKEVVDDSNLS